jgi:Delta7-sterol 5-desaturase
MNEQSLITALSPAGLWIFSTLFLVLRYFVIAGIVFFVFYKIFKAHFISRKIQSRFPKNEMMMKEIKRSMITVVIFSSFALLISILNRNGLTAIYNDFSMHSTFYFFVSVGLLILFHDAYFYWIHYAMHKIPFLMKYHVAHHESHNPTPFTSLSFHPVESMIEIAFFPLIVFFLPVHPIAIAIVGTLSLLFNIFGHSGYELFKPKFLDRPFLKWFNTSTHHNMHHQKANGNYGLYFNFWDTIMKTNFKSYRQHFLRASSKDKHQMQLDENVKIGISQSIAGNR